MRVLTAAAHLLAFAASAVAFGAMAEPAGERLYGGRVLRCESSDGRPLQCPADTRGGVRLIRQSGSCVEGKTWGANRDGVWVAQGCSGDFLLGSGGTGASSNDSTYGNRVLRCESKGGRWTHCPGSTDGGVELVQQLSKNPCMRNQSWGADKRGVWVSGGCRGEFQMISSSPRTSTAQQRRHVVKCESRDKRAIRCTVETGLGVRLLKQLSRSECVEGRTWGYDANGVWVEDGCRAEFEIDYQRNGG